MIDVLLLTVSKSKRFVEPGAILFLAANLRANGYRVAVDEVQDVAAVPEIVSLNCLSTNLPIIGISSLSASRDDTLRIAALIKKCLDRCFIVVGGFGPSLQPDQYLFDESPIDAIVVGDGEDVIVELVWRLKNGMPWQDIPGVGSFVSGKTQIISPAPRRPLDQYPPMARDFLERKIQKWGAKDTYASIFSSRGCYQRCGYCAIQASLDRQPGPRYRLRSIENVVQEIRSIYDRYGITKFIFEDDNFIPPKASGQARVEQFAQALTQLDLAITFILQTRPDTIKPEYISLLKPLGLREVQLGVENINAQDLALYARECTPQQIEQVICDLYLRGYYPTLFNSEYRLRVGYITFHPFVTLESLIHSLRFLRKYALSPNKFLNKLRLYEFSALYERARRENLIENGDYRFVDPQIGVIYRSCSEFFGKWSPLRYFCRNIEKNEFHLNHQVSSVEITSIRTALDNFAFAFFEEMLEGYSRLPEYQETQLHKALMDLERYKLKLATEWNYTNLEEKSPWR